MLGCLIYLIYRNLKVGFLLLIQLLYSELIGLFVSISDNKVHCKAMHSSREIFSKGF